MRCGWRQAAILGAIVAFAPMRSLWAAARRTRRARARAGPGRERDADGARAGASFFAPSRRGWVSGDMVKDAAIAKEKRKASNKKYAAFISHHKLACAMEARFVKSELERMLGYQPRLPSRWVRDALRAITHSSVAANLVCSPEHTNNLRPEKQQKTLRKKTQQEEKMNQFLSLL